MKKFLKIFGLVLLSLVIILGIIIGSLIIFGGKYDESSKNFVDKNVPEILTSWDYKIFCEYAHPNLIASVPEDVFYEKLANLVIMTLGEFVEYISSEGEATITKTNKENTTTAKYVSKVLFVNGNSDVTTNLIYENDKWYIIGLNVKIDPDKLLNMDNE